jgi:hypothetical protein
MEQFEVRTFSRGNSGQTASNLNTINGAAHRFVGSGLNETITLNDFARARHALRMAKVPMNGLVAVVDPTVTYTLQTQSNITNLLTPEPKWQSLVHTGLVTGMNFQFNLFGFDVYESNYLPSSIAETVNGLSTTVGVCNQFFSMASPDIVPYIGAYRQMPTVQSEFNMNLQQTEYLTITEYGVALYRPENMVCVLTDTDQVG